LTPKKVFDVILAIFFPEKQNIQYEKNVEKTKQKITTFLMEDNVGVAKTDRILKLKVSYF